MELQRECAIRVNHLTFNSWNFYADLNWRSVVRPDFKLTKRGNRKSYDLNFLFPVVSLQM